MLGPPTEERTDGERRKDLGSGWARCVPGLSGLVSCRLEDSRLSTLWLVSDSLLGVSSLFYRDTIMAPPNPVEAKRKYFSVEEANKTLPLVKAIVTDIVHQFRVVNELKQRLTAVKSDRRRTSTSDPYSEELAQSETELEAEEEKLAAYIDELTKLGVELKGPDGLCDFYSMMDGREVYLCWRLGEPQVMHWHELNAGVAGRQPLTPHVAARVSAGPRSH